MYLSMLINLNNVTIMVCGLCVWPKGCHHVLYICSSMSQCGDQAARGHKPVSSLTVDKKQMFGI